MPPQDCQPQRRWKSCLVSNRDGQPWQAFPPHLGSDVARWNMFANSWHVPNFRLVLCAMAADLQLPFGCINDLQLFTMMARVPIPLSDPTNPLPLLRFTEGRRFVQGYLYAQPPVVREVVMNYVDLFDPPESEHHAFKVFQDKHKLPWHPLDLPTFVEPGQRGVGSAADGTQRGTFLSKSGWPREKPKSDGPHCVISVPRSLALLSIASRLSTAMSFSIMIRNNTDLRSSR